MALRTTGQIHRTAQPSGEAPLCVTVGDINLVRALGLAGIGCATLTPEEDASRYSRHAHAVLRWVDPGTDGPAFLERILEFAAMQPSAPVVVPQSDGSLLALSRHRDELGRHMRMSLAAPDVVETLLDKARFQERAARLGLPIPPAHLLEPDGPLPAGLEFPVLVKPVSHSPAWEAVEPGKAVRAVDAEALAAMRERAAGLTLVAQQEIPGPETHIESYHVYVDAAGDVVAEFTGRKIRTRPSHYGYSTAVEITDVADVRAEGRDVVGRLDVTGVAKVDFKRGPDGRLHLLEVNPRVSLWVYPGAVAGVNLPALVYADLVGARRPPLRRARAGVTWCQPLEDLRAAREQSQSVLRWLAWLARCDAPASLSMHDPGPFVVGRLWPKLRGAVARR